MSQNSQNSEKLCNHANCQPGEDKIDHFPKLLRHYNNSSPLEGIVADFAANDVVRFNFPAVFIIISWINWNPLPDAIHLSLPEKSAAAHRFHFILYYINIIASNSRSDGFIFYILITTCSLSTNIHKPPQAPHNGCHNNCYHFRTFATAIFASFSRNEPN